MALIYESNYKRLEKLGILAVKTHAKFKASPYMDLSVERLYTNPDGSYVIAMAHYGVQNGDLMADPDMEIRVIPDMKMAEALTWRNDYVGKTSVVYPEPGKVYPKIKADLNKFLAIWLKNIAEQGHKRTSERFGVTIPKKVSRKKSKRITPGMCYEETFNIMLHDNDVAKNGVIIHGKVQDPQTKKWIEHAWIEMGTMVIDPTISESLIRKAQYYEAFNAKPEKEYTELQAIEQVFKKKKGFGKW